MTSQGSWGGTKEAMDKQGSTTFLRLEDDGDKAVVTFCGAPLHREICFNEKTNAYEPWTEAAKAAGRKKTSRYAINVFVLKDKTGEPREMRVLDMNFQTTQQVIALKDKYTLGKCAFEIVRHGAKKDTKTHYVILPDVDITDAVRGACGHQDPKNEDNWIEGTAPLLDLAEATAKGDSDEATSVTDDVKKNAKTNGATTASAPKAAAAAPPPAAATAAPAANNGTTATATLSKVAATEFIDKLKAHKDPKTAVGTLLGQFPYAKKVSEILATDEPRARALVAQLCPSPALAATEDPFA
jgi:hypothetical protein